MAQGRMTTVEVKAGLFLTFCIGLFVAMLFVYGKLSRSWRGRQELRVLFTQVTNLRTDAQVLYNGLDVGKVKAVHIRRVSRELLDPLPVLTAADLENLPLAEEERTELAGQREALDALARHRVQGRTMVELDLEVLAEGDDKRYRVDDQVKITTTLMGESTVEIISGSGTPHPPGETPVILGVSSDIYSDLARSMTEVKNILVSVAEMVGGGADSPVSMKVGNFDRFTERLDGLALKLGGNMEQGWDLMDTRLDEGKEKVDSLEKAIANVRPDLLQALTNASKSLEDVKKQTEEQTASGRAKVKELLQRVKAELQPFAAMAKEHKERAPLLIREARELTEEAVGKVDSVEAWMNESERTLREGAESTRQTLHGMRVLADGLEEKTWYLAHYPWSISSPPRDLEGLALDLEWRKALVERHWQELRGELQKAAQGIPAADASDRARLARVTQILQELDLFVKEPGPVNRPAKE